VSFTQVGYRVIFGLPSQKICPAESNMHSATPAERSPAHVSIPDPILSRERKIWYAGLTSVSFATIQNLDLVTFPLFGINHSPLVATHMHWAALLMTAMLLPDRLYLRVAFITVFLGWFIRYLLQTPAPDVLLILAIILMYVAMYGWTVACARWMGWPRPNERREMRIRDLIPYALIAILLYPLGWSLLHVIMNGLLAWRWDAELAEKLVDVGEHSFLVMMFGILSACLPAVLFGTDRDQLGRSLLVTRDILIIVIYGCLLRMLLAWLSSTPPHIPATLLELRFIFALLLVGCTISLGWRPAAMLVGLTGLLLPTVTEVPKLSTGSEGIRMLRMGLEMGALQLLLALGMLVTRDNRRAFKRLTSKSMHDALSGVPNVNALHRDLSTRNPLPDGIGCLGIERLDAMMAGLGLAAQESLTVAIHRHLLPEIHAYTLGMGRFALLPRGQHANWQDQVLNKLERFDFTYADTNIRIEPHLGVCALHGHDPASMDASLHAAYSAMLTAWQRGETVPVFAPEQTPSLPVRQTLQTHALALSLVRQRQIELYVQRLRRIDGSQADMGEVLCRLRTPAGQLMMPSEYMDELNVSRGMVELDQEVVKSVLAWMHEHPDNAGFSRLCVNLTGRSLVSKHFRDWLLQQLDRFPAAAGRLGFELTEHTIEGDFTHTRLLLSTLQQRGCLIALDDFGTGMQSFERLQRLNVDLIKIDGRFVRDIARNRHDRALVSTMATIAKAYGAQTVAEHVEDDTALQYLRRLGVDWAQGFHIDQPTRLCPPPAH